MESLRFRALWVFLAAADHGSTNQAAKALNLTQPAVSHAIKLIEERMGLPLFNRRTKGMALTELGQIFSKRVRRALAHLLTAETEIARLVPQPKGREYVQGLHLRLTRQQLISLVSVTESGNVQYAAQQTGYSQSVIWHALRELKGLVGENLVEHRPSCIVLSLRGDILVRYAKLALAELRYADDDLAAFQGSLSGRVIIGALPLSRTILLPRAIARMSPRHPNLEFTLVDGPYSTLMSALRCGDVDLIVGALRSPAPANDVIEEVLFREPLSITASRRNPLTQRRGLRLHELTRQQWVLPIRGTPTRSIFESLFTTQGLPLPTTIIESSSLVATRALLLESDYLTFISRSQIHYEDKFGILAALDVEGLADTERPIGITTRADAALSPGVRELIRRLHTVSRKLYLQPQAARDNSLSKVTSTLETERRA